MERLGWHKDVVELQLDHKVRDANGEAYNRTQFTESRSEMMQAWSDYLDQPLAETPQSVPPHHSSPSATSSRTESNGTELLPKRDRQGLCDHGPTNDMVESPHSTALGQFPD